MGDGSSVRDQDIEPLNFFLELVCKRFDRRKAGKVDQPKLGPVEPSALFKALAIRFSEFRGTCKEIATTYLSLRQSPSPDFCMP